MTQGKVASVVVTTATLGVYAWMMLGDSQRRTLRTRFAYEFSRFRLVARRFGEPAWLTELRENHIVPGDGLAVAVQEHET